MSVLLPELVTDILLRLPVSSLLRFRCLSRSLCSEIGSEKFVKNHLNSSIQRKTRQKLIIYSSLVVRHSNDFYFADFDDDLVDAFPFSPPLTSHRRHTFIYGSCNGLILLGAVSSQNKTMNLAVWNPCSRRHRKLPLCPVQHGGFMSFGLGYDSAHDDYKVVVICKFKVSNRVSSQVWIFGLKSDFWRRGDLEAEVTTSSGCFANGALYWVCKNKGVGFDLDKEVFFDISLPSAAFYFNFFLVFGGNLYFPTVLGQTLEYYLLVSDVSDKGGEVVGVSWRKEFTMENVETVWHRFYPPCPLACSKDGDSILLDKLDGIFWHNLGNSTKQRVNIAGLPDSASYDYNVCWESLVSVGKDGAFDGAAEEEI